MSSTEFHHFLSVHIHEILELVCKGTQEAFKEMFKIIIIIFFFKLLKARCAEKRARIKLLT